MFKVSKKIFLGAALALSLNSGVRAGSEFIDCAVGIMGGITAGCGANIISRLIQVPSLRTVNPLLVVGVLTGPFMLLLRSRFVKGNTNITSTETSLVAFLASGVATALGGLALPK